MKRTNVSAVPALECELPPVADTEVPITIPIGFDELVERLQSALLPHGFWCHPIELSTGGFGILEIELRDGGRVYLMKDYVARARALNCIDDAEAPQIWWK
jgi:hypothetical protein